jgi:hypothetical protein
MPVQADGRVPIDSARGPDEFMSLCIVIHLQQKIICFSGPGRLLTIAADRSLSLEKSQHAEQHDAEQHAQHDINRHRVRIASYCRAYSSG